MLRQTRFTDHGINIMKNLGLEKNHRQGTSKDYVALQFLVFSADYVLANHNLTGDPEILKKNNA